MDTRSRASAFVLGGLVASVASVSTLVALVATGNERSFPALLMRYSFWVGATFTVGGAIVWVRTWPKGQRLGAALRGLVVFAVLALFVAAGGRALVGWVTAPPEPSRSSCLRGASAPMISAREALLEEGRAAGRAADRECVALAGELDALASDGRCPLVPPLDGECRCGDERWDPRSPVCRSGPTTCESRDGADAEGLGCAADDGRRLLDAARSAQRALR